MARNGDEHLITISYRAETLERIYQGLIDLHPFECARVAHVLNNSSAMLRLTEMLDAKLVNSAETYCAGVTMIQFD